MPEPAAMRDRTCSPQWQVRFDDGHQQRYLPDRAAVLRYVLAVAPRTASKRFEVFAETGQVALADGSPGGRQFALTDVIDMSQHHAAERLRAELTELAASGRLSAAPNPPKDAR